MNKLLYESLVQPVNFLNTCYQEKNITTKIFLLNFLEIKFLLYNTPYTCVYGSHFSKM